MATNETGRDKIIAARNMMIEAKGRIFALYGMPDVVGRIYGLLYFTEQPLGLEEIATELGVSKATVSINVRTLEALKCVRKVWQKGNRRDFYEAERDFTKAFMEVLRVNMAKELAIAEDAIEQSRKILDDVNGLADSPSGENKKFHREQLALLSKQYRNYGRLLKFLGMGEKLWNTVLLRDKGGKKQAEEE